MKRIGERGNSDASWWALDALNTILGATSSRSAAIEVPRLMTGFRAGDLSARDFADRIRPFGSAASAAKELLIPAIQQGDEWSRTSVFEALCGMSRGDEKTAALLVGALRQGKVNRARALTALTELGPREGQTAAFIAEFLQSDDPRVREEAAAALSAVEITAAEVHALRKALKDREFSARFNAAFSLWKATGEREPLEQAVVVAFGNRERIAEDDYNMYYRRRSVLSTIAEMQTEGAFLATALIPALALDNEELVVKAAGVLGRLGPGAKAAIPALATLAKSTDYPLRKAALDALRKLDPRPAAEKGP